MQLLSVFFSSRPGKGRQKTAFAPLTFFDIVAQVHCRCWQQPGLERLVIFAEGAHLHEEEQREKTRTSTIASE
jgi:hypothetical protein